MTKKIFFNIDKKGEEEKNDEKNKDKDIPEEKKIKRKKINLQNLQMY